MIHQVKGIILKKQNYRESDRLFVIYADKFGKIEALARGVRKIKSRLASHLDFFSIINLMVAPGKTYYQIAGAEIDKNFLNIKSNLTKIILGSHCLEIVDGFVKIGCSDIKIFDLLKDLFFIFNDETKDSLKLYSLTKFFIFKFLTLLGWTPELSKCVRCEKKIISNDNLFDAGRGGLICRTCGHEGVPISIAAVKILRFIAQNNLKSLTIFEMNKSQLREIARVVDLLMAAHQDKEFKSAKWTSLIFSKKINF